MRFSMLLLGGGFLITPAYAGEDIYMTLEHESCHAEPDEFLQEFLAAEADGEYDLRQKYARYIENDGGFPRGVTFLDADSVDVVREFSEPQAVDNANGLVYSVDFENLATATLVSYPRNWVLHEPPVRKVEFYKVACVDGRWNVVDPPLMKALPGTVLRSVSFALNTILRNVLPERRSPSQLETIRILEREVEILKGLTDEIRATMRPATSPGRPASARTPTAARVRTP